MVSSFNIEKLNSLLKDFYTLTKIRITVFDASFVELTAYPQARSPLCRFIRSDSCAKENCRLCDEHACKTASKRNTAYTYQCHAGLTESIMPLTVGNIVIGYLFLGQALSFDSSKNAFKNIQKYCSNYELDTKELEKLCCDHPLCSSQYIVAASHISQAVASYVCLERMATLNPEKISIQINEYISTHLAEELTVEIICNYFQIGKTCLYALSNKYFGMGIASFIRKARIDKAKELLIESPDLKLAEVALRCGFRDYNYFITVFKRVVGVSPKKYNSLYSSE